QWLREVVVLLDRHDRHVARRNELADSAFDVLDDRWLDAFRGLIKDQKARTHGKRPADRELLLLPAGNVAASTAEHFLLYREHLEEEFEDYRTTAPRRERNL